MHIRVHWACGQAPRLLFSMLDSAEHEMLPGSKQQITEKYYWFLAQFSLVWHFLCFWLWKCQHELAFSYLSVKKISCSAEMSRARKRIYNLGVRYSKECRSGPSLFCHRFQKTTRQLQWVGSSYECLHSQFEADWNSIESTLIQRHVVFDRHFYGKQFMLSWVEQGKSFISIFGWLW